MNLKSLVQSAPEPRSVCTCLELFFASVEIQHRLGSAIPYEIQARDDTGRLRLRLPYFWSERWERWFYLLLPGDPHE